MDLRSFRRVGFIYAVLCFILSAIGAVYFFKDLINSQKSCADFVCENGTENIIFLVVNMVTCLLSATFALFVKIGIEEAVPGYIHVSRVYMLIRSIILTVKWTYESVALKVEQLNGDDTPEIATEQNTATLLLISITALTGLELWILDRVHQYVKQQRLNEDNFI